MFFAVLVARAALADPAPTQAQAEALYAEGSKHYNLREYAPAIDAFKRAYSLYPEPTFLFDIAQAYRLLNDCETSAVFYRNYVRAKPDADDRDQAEKLAGEMSTCAAEQKRERDNQHERERERERVAVPPTLPPPPPPSGHRGLQVVGLVTAGVGVALAGAGVYFSLDASDKAHRIEQLCATSCNATDVASSDTSGKSSSHLAIGMYVIGGLAVGVGSGLFVWALRTGPETITVAPIRGGVAVSTTVHF